MIKIQDKSKKEKNGKYLLKSLIESNPDILLAKQIMDENRKVQHLGVVLDSNNYYKLYS